jgi:hypothetical protein
LRSLRNSANEDSEDETLVDDSDSSTGSTTKKRVTTERIILRNMARDQALQINAPIGKDLWKAIDRIVIEHNTAEGEAVQVNYNNTLEDTIALITLSHKLKLEARKQTSSYGRRDSLMSPP